MKITMWIYAPGEEKEQFDYVTPAIALQRFRVSVQSDNYSANSVLPEGVTYAHARKEADELVSRAIKEATNGH